jgi:hypothetical protein
LETLEESDDLTLLGSCLGPSSTRREFRKKGLLDDQIAYHNLHCLATDSKGRHDVKRIGYAQEIPTERIVLPR